MSKHFPSPARMLGSLTALLVAAGSFWVADFYHSHPHQHTHAVDIPLSGEAAWRLPRIREFQEEDVVYISQHPENAISGVLLRSDGNFVVMRFELRRVGDMVIDQGLDLLIAFRWKGAGDNEKILPGLEANIKNKGGWDCAAVVRDNANSSLWGMDGKEVRPTYINRTHFDNENQSITIIFSKLLLVAAGWNGVDAVYFSPLVLRDGAVRISDYSGLGAISPAEWGGRTWLWNTEWLPLSSGVGRVD